MSEIAETDARKILPEDATTLIMWRDFADEGIVEGLSMQTLLDLYHASTRYVTLEGWLEEEESAIHEYREIVERGKAS